jgi:hypothetical protein
MISARTFSIAALICIAFSVYVNAQGVPVSKDQCPNSCSGHGQCYKQTDGSKLCRCITGWQGDDCSIQMTPVSSGQVVNDNVGTFQWKFYTFAVPPQGTHSVSVHMKTIGTGDCDLYLRYGTAPTSDDYDKRDISFAPNVTLNVDNARGGTWWAGVFGFTECAYQFQAVVTGACPQNCNGNGDCLNGACRCYSGYFGEACEHGEEDLELGQEKQGTLATGDWRYYQLNLAKKYNKLTVFMHQTSATGDCDLYVRRDGTPDFFHWDYLNSTLAADSTVAIADADRGYWYIGVYGFSACSFTIKATTSDAECPSRCSNHGNCVSGANTHACQCNAGYLGDYCETKTDPLVLGTSERGFVTDNAWNYYTFQTFTARTVSVIITQESATHDCDVYVKKDGKPTRINYDYADERIGQNTTLAIPNPLQGTFWVGVYGWTACAYRVTVVESSSCLQNCNNHGHCVSGQCVCDRGFAGASCNLAVTTLTVGQKATGTLRANQWVYYSFNAISSSIYVHLREISSDGSGGFIWLFASDDTTPTLNVHDVADQTALSTHMVQFEYEDAVDSRIIIGVYGSPYQVSQSTATNFELVAWATPF